MAVRPNRLSTLEVFEGEGGSPRSDQASLGYVRVEMLGGAALAGIDRLDALLHAKKSVLDT
jgi:hypothetical protein